MISAEIKAWLTVIGVVAVIVCGSLFWAHYSGLKADLKTAQASIAVLEENLKIEKETTKQLGVDLTTANAQTTLTKELYTAAEKQRVAQFNENVALNKKVKQITASLPIPARKQDAIAMSTEEEASSYKRITTLWDVYCVTNPENEKCTVIAPGKPVSDTGQSADVDPPTAVSDFVPDIGTVQIAAIATIDVEELIE